MQIKDQQDLIVVSVIMHNVINEYTPKRFSHTRNIRNDNLPKFITVADKLDKLIVKKQCTKSVQDALVKMINENIALPLTGKFKNYVERAIEFKNNNHTICKYHIYWSLLHLARGDYAEAIQRIKVPKLYWKELHDKKQT